MLGSATPFYPTLTLSLIDSHILRQTFSFEHPPRTIAASNMRPALARQKSRLQNHIIFSSRSVGHDLPSRYFIIGSHMVRNMVRNGSYKN